MKLKLITAITLMFYVSMSYGVGAGITYHGRILTPQGLPVSGTSV